MDLLGDEPLLRQTRRMVMSAVLLKRPLQRRAIFRIRQRHIIEDVDEHMLVLRDGLVQRRAFSICPNP